MEHMKPHLITEYEIRDKSGNIKRTYPFEKPDLKPDKMIINIMTKGGIIKKHIEQPFASWLANFTRLLNYCWMQIANNTGGSANDKIIEHLTGGVTSLTTDAFLADVTEAALGIAAVNVYGIMIGDMDNDTALGLTVESGIGNILHYNDWMLRALLTNDDVVTPPTTKTDLETRATNLSMPDETTLVISRRFQNDSAVDIYVNECGLIGKSNGAENILLARDILDDGGPATGVPITVEPTEIIEISYTFTVSSTGGLTSNWLKYLSSILGDAVPVSAMKDTSNSEQATADPSGMQVDQNMIAAQDDDTFGIVVGGWLSDGTGVFADPFETSNYRLADKLADSEIDHGPMVSIDISLQSTYTQFGMYRDFENDNTTTVYVVDSGLYMDDNTLTKRFLMARSVPTSVITVLPDEILRVKKYMKFNL